VMARLVKAASWPLRVAVAALLALLGRRRERPEEERSSRQLPATRGRERLVLSLLAASSLAAIGFIVVYAAGGNTQLLGAAIGAALGLLGVAAIVASKVLVPQEEATEERPRFARPDEGEEEEEAEGSEAARTLVKAGEGITRRRLITAAGAAGVALGAAAATPLASLGPGVGDTLFPSPWRAGTPLVDENGLRVRADDLEQGSFLTAFPEGADPRQLASAVVVVRVNPAGLDLPADRADWAPEGYLAFSKICTHAGCAVNLFRSPQYPPKEPGPALVCPCHYSTFDVLKGGERTFGPAGRPLPQLPLRIDASRHLIAGGQFSAEVGPAWSGVRQS
jgi:quinol---cytochrome c reductase iron-sulfur subunit